MIPGDADHSFRGDPDQLITIVGTVITMPGMVIAIIPERFPQGGVALDITDGKLFLLFDLRESQRADQEIVERRMRTSFAGFSSGDGFSVLLTLWFEGEPPLPR